MILTRDQTFTVVCNVRTPIGNDTENVGTGIFISNQNKAYLVTAEHVAKTTTADTYHKKDIISKCNIGLAFSQSSRYLLFGN